MISIPDTGKILDALLAHVAILDEAGTILAVNQSWRNFADYNALIAGSYGVGSNYLEVCDRAKGECAEEAPFAAQGIRDVIAGRSEQFWLDYPCHAPDEQRWFQVRVSRLHGLPNPSIVVTHENITEVKRNENALFEEKERARVTLQSIADGVITTDAGGAIEYMNPVAEALTGWLGREARGLPLEKVFSIVNKDTGACAADELGHSARCDCAGLQNCVLMRHGGGSIWVQHSVAPIRSREGEIVGTVVVFQDVTEVHRVASELSHQATHDALTGLVNRREFEDRLKRLMETVRGEGGKHVLCYVDLDQFKVINDTCGHVAGDELLRELASMLRNHIRERDTLARLGGDEFGVLIEHCPLNYAERIANTLCDAIGQFRFVWGGKRFGIGASIGLVPITATSGSVTAVLSAADSACYAAKDKGRNRISIYREADAELDRRQSEMQWVGRINQALEENRFRLHAQPIVPVWGGADKGAHYELLLRLEEEDGSVVQPSTFMSAAERYDMLTKIDHWVIRSAFRWLNRYPDHVKQLYLCEINISGHSLTDDEFLNTVIGEFNEVRVAPSKICFEITETNAITNLASARRFIQTLKGLGCRFALDDFGSGLSSFAYLKTLPVDFLKIDGVFVKDIVENPLDLQLLKSINDIAHVLGKQTIAEFVEDVEILGKLKSGGVGVDYVQGYGVGVPRPIEELLDDATHFVRS